MQGIEITMTATIRADIINQTFTSFRENFIDYDIKKNSKLIVNIDPSPSEDIDKIDDVVKVCHDHFDDVLYNIPNSPNFTKSVNWCWKNARSDIIFHLEDDWKLLENIKVEDIIENYMIDGVNQVILRAYGYTYRKMALSPSFIRKEWYKKFVDQFDFERNPELQLRKDFVDQKQLSVYGSHPIVMDIGRNWINSTMYSKPRLKENFVRWSKKG